MISKYIESVGFELECGTDFDYKNFKVLAKNERFERTIDNSVFVPECEYDGEEFKFWSSKLGEVLKIGKILWEKMRIKQNSTCGNHFHFRFSEKVRGGVFWQDFVEKFLELYQKEYHNNPKYLFRLNNQYCKKNEKDYVERFLDKKSVSRYRSINFLSFLEHQKTLEIRIMPYAENFDEWKSQLLFEIRFINNYFRKFKKVEKIEIKREKLNKKVFYEVVNLKSLI